MRVLKYLYWLFVGEYRMELFVISALTPIRV